MKLSSLIAQSTAKLALCSETPRLDAEILLSHTLNKSREDILTHPEIKLNVNQIKAYKKLLVRRQTGEPIAYLVGYKFFYGLKFKVNRHTLIPRPETELMVEQALKSIVCDTDCQTKNTIILDVGTGSGAIIISLFKQLTINNKKLCIDFFATDISDNALRIAKQNAKNNRIKSIAFLKSDLLNHRKIKRLFQQEKPLVILANLPYLSQKIYTSAPVSVRGFEPATALVSGQNGLNHYQKLLTQLSTFLQTKNRKRQVVLFCEISPEQKPLIIKKIKLYFPKAEIKFFKDLADKWRLVKIKLFPL